MSEAAPAPAPRRRMRTLPIPLVRDPDKGCVLWPGARSRNYGVVGINTRRSPTGGPAIVKATRLLWEIVNGPIPDGLFVCHRCDNPPCVRIDHLFLGTAKDNSEDMLRKGRGRHGVPWDGTPRPTVPRLSAPRRQRRPCAPKKCALPFCDRRIYVGGGTLCGGHRAQRRLRKPFTPLRFRRRPSATFEPPTETP